MDNVKMYNAVIAVCEKTKFQMLHINDVEKLKCIIEADLRAIESMCKSAIHLIALKEIKVKE